MTRHGRVGGLSFLWAFSIIVAGSVFAMFASNTDWLGSWRQAIDNSVGTVVITGPLLAGLIAGSYASLRQTAFGDLVPVSARPLRGWFGPALRYWGAASCALLLLLVSVTVRAAFLEVPLAARQAVIIPLGITVLAVHALVGMAIGLRAGPRYAAVLAALVSFGLFLLATDRLAPPSFVTGGVTGPMFGEQYRIGSVLELYAFAVASCVALAPWVWWTDKTQSRRWAVSLMAVGITVGMAQMTWPDLEARLEPASASYECTGSAPAVCMVADRPNGNLRAIASRLGGLAEPLRQAGASLPAEWIHSLPGRRSTTSGALSVSVEAELGGMPEDNELLLSLTMPAGCAAFTTDQEPSASFAGRVRMLQWLTFRNGLDRGTRFPPWFATEKAEAWVRTTYDQLRRCDLDAIRRP